MICLYLIIDPIICLLIKYIELTGFIPINLNTLYVIFIVFIFLPDFEFGDTLTVYYTQYLQGVPVRGVTFKRQVPHAQVTFDYSGVNYVSISEYTYEVMEYTDKILTYEEALEIFKKTISKDADCDGKVYDKVEFGYVLIKEYINGNFEIIAVPSWQFNFEGIPNAIISGYDVIVNAIDGSVYK